MTENRIDLESICELNPTLTQKNIFTIFGVLMDCNLLSISIGGHSFSNVVHRRLKI